MIDRYSASFLKTLFSSSSIWTFSPVFEYERTFVCIDVLSSAVSPFTQSFTSEGIVLSASVEGPPAVPQLVYVRQTGFFG